MYESLTAAIAGLQQLLTWPTPGYLLAGVLIGYVAGVLPGLGAPAALAFLLPAVVTLPPLDGFVLLTATSAVAAAAGDITSILLGIPGEATAAAIVADGHALAKQGRGRYATGAAITASLMGALIGLAVLVAFIPLAPSVLRHIGSPELAALAIVGICLLVPLSQADPVKGLLSGALGLALSTVGLDPFRGEPRFTFGQLTLFDGLGLLPIALGIFAVSEALEMIRSRRVEAGAPVEARGVMRGAGEALRQSRLVGRCGAIGAVIGSLPGVGAVVTQWIAYAHAARTAKGDVAPGSGAIEGVIGPAAATTATHGGAMVPTLSLGIPGGLSSSFLLSAMILKGIAPGPAMLAPERTGGQLSLVFALIWCTVIASAIGAAIGMTSLGWVGRLARVRPARLFPVIVTLVLIGTVGERHSHADLGILLVLGCLGYAMTVLRFPKAPLMLGFVLGPLVERRVLLSNTLYGWTWVLRPTVLALAAAVTIALLLGRRAARRRGEARSPRRRGASSPSADAAMSVFLGAIAIGGLALSFWLSGRASAFPRVVFSAMLGLSLLQLLVSWRATARGALVSHVPVSDHLLRIAWFAVFVITAWIFGLVIGTILSVAIYLRLDAKASWLATVTITGVLGGVTWLLVAQVLQLSDRGWF